MPICCSSRSADVAMQMRSVQEIFQFLCKSLGQFDCLKTLLLLAIETQWSGDKIMIDVGKLKLPD